MLRDLILAGLTSVMSTRWSWGGRCGGSPASGGAVGLNTHRQCQVEGKGGTAFSAWGNLQRENFVGKDR